MTKLTDLSTNIDSRIKLLARQIPNYAGKDSELAKLLDIVAEGVDNYRAEVASHIDDLQRATGSLALNVECERGKAERFEKWLKEMTGNRDELSRSSMHYRDELSELKKVYDGNVAELKALAFAYGKLDDENKALKAQIEQQSPVEPEFLEVGQIRFVCGCKAQYIFTPPVGAWWSHSAECTECGSKTTLSAQS